MQKKKFRLYFPFLLGILYVCVIFPSHSLDKAENGEQNRGVIPNALSSHSVPFIENIGQVKNEKVRFYKRTSGGVFCVTKNGSLIYSFRDFDGKKGIKGWALEESYHNVYPSTIRGLNRSEIRINYLKGNNSSDWKSGIPAFEQVSLGEIDPGIELRVEANKNTVEKIFILQPEADPEKFRARIDGALGLEVNGEGELEVKTGAGTVIFTKPVAYQNDEGRKTFVGVEYVIDGKEYGFELENYDRTKKLVIDPLLASTYLGGKREDTIYGIDLGEDGNVYVVGKTHSIDFPVTFGAYDQKFSGDTYDCFISVFNDKLKKLLASTYFGGKKDEGAYSICLNSQDDIYVCGETNSSDFPKIKSVEATAKDPDTDVFVMKFDRDLERVLESYRIGGKENDIAVSLVLDEDEYVYIAGSTQSSDYPTTQNAYDTTFNGGFCDAFVSKLSGNLENLVASTFLGGRNEDRNNALVIDPSGKVYLAGFTDSPNFPTKKGALDRSYNGNLDAYVSKLTGDLKKLQASTYLGGKEMDYATHSLGRDKKGNIYVAGYTRSADFPVKTSTYDKKFNGTVDIFISKLNKNLKSLVGSTYLGGFEFDYVYDLTVSKSQHVYITGFTHSPDFPTTKSAYDTSCGTDGNCNHARYVYYADAFIAKFRKDLKKLLASTYLGGEKGENAKCLVLDPEGNVYVAGGTDSKKFPTTKGVYDRKHNGVTGELVISDDAFIAKFDKNFRKK